MDDVLHAVRETLVSGVTVVAFLIHRAHRAAAPLSCGPTRSPRRHGRDSTTRAPSLRLRLAAHTVSMPSGEAQHHRQLAPKPVRGADGGIIMEAFDPEGEVPYYSR